MFAYATPLVLIIEGDWLLRVSLADEFMARGWNVLDAASGEHALQLASDYRVDVMITDVHLTGPITGWDVAEALRASRPELRVLYTSSRGTDTSRQVSGSVFFEKPYDYTRIVGVSRNLLDNGPTLPGATL